MQFIYLQQSGKPVEGSSGVFWSLAGVAVAAERWRALQLRLNGLMKSFQKSNYTPGATRIRANDLLHPRNAERPWTTAYCKGLEKIASTLDLKFFLVVIDKRTTDKPAHPKWLLPLSYHYLMKPVNQFLRESRCPGSLVIPVGREEERQTLSELQFSGVFSPQGKSSPLVASPLMQQEGDSAGLQIADFVATVARRYHEHTYPKLFNKIDLDGYDQAINSHYQGFVKPRTYQSASTDQKGFRIRGYIYLWRREGVSGTFAKPGEFTSNSGSSSEGARKPDSRESSDSQPRSFAGAERSEGEGEDFGDY